MCAYKDMKRVRPGHFMLTKPTCDYQALPPFKPWFCPCPNVEALEGRINADQECTALLTTDPTDATSCRTSPVCFTKCLLNEEAVSASQHNGDVQAKYDFRSMGKPWDDVDELYAEDGHYDSVFRSTHLRCTRKTHNIWSSSKEI